MNRAVPLLLGELLEAAELATAAPTSRTPPRVPETLATSAFRSAWGRVSFTWVNTGTKAVENDPSANNRRRKFGIRNATQNASVAALAPNA